MRKQSYRPQEGTAIEKQKHKKQLKQTAVEYARRVRYPFNFLISNLIYS